MKIKIIQDLIDTIREKNQELKIPLIFRNVAFRLQDKGIITTNRRVFQSIVKYNKSKDTPLFYNNLKSFCSKNIFPERYENKIKYFKEKFIPLINKDDLICDIGCANGDFTFEFAKYCKHIDGYELSQKMVDTANERAKAENVENINFYQSSCESIDFNKTYDKICLMGVLCYVLDDELVRKTISNMTKALKPNGYIIYRDNLNLDIFPRGGGDYYFFGPSPAYKMVARAKSKIMKIFQENGYEVVDEKILHNLTYNILNKNKEFNTVSLTMILKNKDK